jgi:hypothetical protein
MCDGCALANKADGILLCTKCGTDVKKIENAAGNKHYAVPRMTTKFDDVKLEEREEKMADALESLKLRDRKNIERKMETGEIKYSHKLNAFVYTDDETKQVELRAKTGNDDDYDDESDEDMDDSDD